MKREAEKEERGSWEKSFWKYLWRGLLIALSCLAVLFLIGLGWLYDLTYRPNFGVRPGNVEAITFELNHLHHNSFEISSNYKVEITDKGQMREIMRFLTKDAEPGAYQRYPAHVFGELTFYDEGDLMGIAEFSFDYRGLYYHYATGPAGPFRVEIDPLLEVLESAGIDVQLLPRVDLRKRKSYEVAFLPCRVTAGVEYSWKPFPDEKIDPPADETLRVQERRDIAELLASHGATKVEGSEEHYLETSDGGSAHFWFSRRLYDPWYGNSARVDDRIGMVRIHSLSDQIVEVIYKIAANESLSMYPWLVRDSVNMVTSESNRQKIAHEFPEAEFIRTPEELYDRILPGYEHRQEEIRQAIEDEPAEPLPQRSFLTDLRYLWGSLNSHGHL